jgi:hypothetical protein
LASCSEPLVQQSSALAVYPRVSNDFLLVILAVSSAVFHAFFLLSQRIVQFSAFGNEPAVRQSLALAVSFSFASAGSLLIFYHSDLFVFVQFLDFDHSLFEFPDVVLSFSIHLDFGNFDSVV